MSNFLIETDMPKSRNFTLSFNVMVNFIIECAMVNLYTCNYTKFKILFSRTNAENLTFNLSFLRLIKQKRYFFK